jgi:hypothetical protein
MDGDIELEWDDANIEHIARHGVTPAEVEEAFRGGVAEVRGNRARAKAGRWL